MSRAYTPDPRTNPYRRINLALTVPQMEALVEAAEECLAGTDPEAGGPLRRGMERLRKVLARDEEDR